MKRPVQVFDGRGFEPGELTGTEHLQQAVRDCSDAIGWSEAKKKEGGAVTVDMTVSNNRTVEITSGTYELLLDRYERYGKHNKVGGYLTIEFWRDGKFLLAHGAYIYEVYDMDFTTNSIKKAHIIARRVSKA